MAEIKISEMDPAVSIIGSDIVAGLEDGDNVKIEAEDILMTRSIDAIRWQSFRISPTTSKAGGSKDPDFIKLKDNGSGSQGVFLYHFSATAEEELYFDVMAPTDWKEGTTIYAQVDWIPVTNGDAGEKVSWGIEYTEANRGSVFGNTNIIL